VNGKVVEPRTVDVFFVCS